MKKLLFLSLLAASLINIECNAQADKSQRPSPPAKVTATTAGGLTITIDYSQPAVKGRTIGKDIAPYGKVWRTGANEATIFEISRDASIEGKKLTAGKYSLYSIPGETEWTLIFNKTANQWGTRYTEADDALRVNVAPGKAETMYEKMTFDVNKQGVVNLWWANTQVRFSVK